MLWKMVGKTEVLSASGFGKCIPGMILQLIVFLAIDAPGGFLLEWWSIFWDITRTNEKHSEPAAAYTQTQLYKKREQQQQQQLQMQQLQQMQQHPPLGDPMNSEGMMKMQLIPGNTGGMSAAMQQMQVRPQPFAGEGHLGATHKSLSLDASSIYGVQEILQSKYGLGGAGLNQRVSELPLEGFTFNSLLPLIGIDQLGTISGLQNPNLRTQNQFLLASQQQQALPPVYEFETPSFLTSM